jgi:hypothetical protein
MSSSGTLRSVALIRADVSEEISASIIRVRISELRTMLVVAINQCMLRRNTNFFAQAAKQYYVLLKPHGATSQKGALFT